MNPIRHLSRPTARRLNRPWSRSLARSCLRRVIPRRRGPDELSQALTAFGRAIRCHRRLAKLAPRFFDPVTVEQERLHHAERQAWMAQWLPTLNRVYGLDPNTPDPESARPLPPLPSLAVQATVDQELAALSAWMEAGRVALAQFRERRPHALPSLTQIARLLAIGTTFARYACGYDPARPAPPPPNYDQVWADLARSYPAEPPASHPPGSAAAGSGISSPNAAPPPFSPSPPVSQPSSPSLPPDDKRDLIPHYLVTGPHGLLCLQPIVVSPKY